MMCLTAGTAYIHRMYGVGEMVHLFEKTADVRACDVNDIWACWKAQLVGQKAGLHAFSCTEIKTDLLQNVIFYTCRTTSRNA